MREGALCANTSQIMRAAVVSNVPTYFAKVKNKYWSVEELINVGGADAHLPRWEFLCTHIFAAIKTAACVSRQKLIDEANENCIHTSSHQPLCLPGFFTACCSFYVPSTRVIIFASLSRHEAFLYISLLSKWAFCSVHHFFCFLGLLHLPRRKSTSRVLLRGVLWLHPRGRCIEVLRIKMHFCVAWAEFVGDFLRGRHRSRKWPAGNESQRTKEN